MKKTNDWMRAMAVLAACVITAIVGASFALGHANADSEWAMANVTNGKIADAMAATGDSTIVWTPPRPGEPCLVQIDVTGSLTWCLQVKAVDSASVPYATVATGTGDQNIVTTAWTVMNLKVSSYSSGSVSAWGAQGTR